MNPLNLTVTQIIDQPNETKTFVLKPHAHTNWKPGQFISIDVVIQGITYRRSYSIHSSPQDQLLQISIKRIENGAVSRYFHDHIRVGAVINGFEPTGRFVYEPQTASRDICLFAAGTGITPMLPIVHAALRQEPQSHIILVYSNRSLSSSLFYDELRLLQESAAEQFTLIPFWSDAKNLMRARLNRDTLESILRNQLRYDKEKAICYTCGPADYMLMCRIVLTGWGMRPEHILRETFVLPEDEGDDDKPEELPKPELLGTHQVSLTNQGQLFTFDVTYPETIMQAAHKQGIELPYSCENGICGTCAANCTSGKVEMIYNEVLTDREVQSGRVLVCTAQPATTHVKIEY